MQAAACARMERSALSTARTSHSASGSRSIAAGSFSTGPPTIRRSMSSRCARTSVEAGVAITGTVKVPIVKVTSNPPVPENEALAWLVTGQGLNTSGRVDYGALSAASAALLARNGKPFTADVAQRLGLDEISLQSSATSASGAQGTASQVVVFGKRISDKLSLGYEQGLSLATSAVRLEYALSQQVTLRAEAGTTSGISIVYRRNFR